MSPFYRSLSRKGAVKKSDHEKTYGSINSEPPVENEPTQYTVVTVEPIQKLRSQISEVKGILKDDIEKVIERGDKVHDLDDRARNLENTSGRFRENAVILRKETQRRNWKLIACLVCVVVVVLVAVAVIVLYALKII